ncbi:hypothetical protein ACHAXR_003747 [Thalassiosira sp. AJA248-18]
MDANRSVDMGGNGKQVGTASNSNDDGEFQGKPKCGSPRHGKGEGKRVNDVYEGELKDGNPHGNGTFTDVSGTVYKGDFQNGKKSWKWQNEVH